ncbi:fas-binding factor 1 homolog [Amyelois transitella]|uniref:fas-binding factor 1 homolog n=1 Tax=Amyelois transitella TaxID=680683 RepID=UPI00298FEEE6|nr:fas-binding factor 1 homolog [Amyelois transitella]
MSFNIDDPLAGILSDGSDDSFFDDDIIGKKKPAKKKMTPTMEKKNALFDLDSDKPVTSDKNTGILEEKIENLSDLGKRDSRKELDFDLTSTKVSKDPFKMEITKSKVTEKIDTVKSPAKTKSASHEALDMLGELGVTKKETMKPLEKGKSSQSLLDDILGGPSKTVVTSQARPSTGAKKSEFDFDSILGINETKQTVSAAARNVSQKPATVAKSEKTKEDAPKKKTSEDWLGIFKDKDENNDENDDDMPAWLVGGDSKKKKAEQLKKAASKPAGEEVKKEVKAEEEATRQKDPIQINMEQINVPPSAGLLYGSNENMATEGATLYLQQQESQLMVALQLKAQEEKLAALQMRQKESQRVQREAALAQHAQLDAMLQRQAAHRQQMQAIISAHQERITQRIKALLGTSDVDVDGGINTDAEVEPTEHNNETPHMKEKKQLLQLVQSLQENHDKEIDLMETSYRRQLAFLEISLSQSEERMKEESDKLVKFYSEKISWLEEHHHLHKKLTEDNLNELTERHKAENEMLRQQYLENVRVLQEHHASLMENIKKAVKQEQILIQDAAGFSSNLQELVMDVKESKSQCQILVERVQTISENNQKDIERSLQFRESHINDILEQLKKERENFENEKSETREIVKTMENRLKQMTNMMEEDAASMKQKKMEFEFEKATFSKQTEFAKNLLKKQDEEIKMMREEIQKEYQEKISKIDEEKKKAVKDSALLAKEKASIQTVKQELETLKAELQAQLEEVTEERSKLNVDKQHMHMEEQRILAKSRDLDLLAKTAIDRQSQADKKYSEAEYLQRKYEERIRRIQEHVVSLNTREKQIAREKVALSRERLNLHNERKQIESRLPCSLCKSSQNVPQYYEPNYLTDFNVSVTRDGNAPNVEVSSAMNAIEQEMAFLMSRNFSLRHGATTAVHEGRGGGDDLQNNQPESGILKDYMDPKLMMLRLDVQQVLSNLDHSKKEEEENINVEE